MSLGCCRYWLTSIGLLLASFPHWGAGLIQAAIATAFGCEVIDQCGAAGRMLWIWSAGILPLWCLMAIGFIAVTSPGVRRAGVIVWLSCLVGALAPVTGATPPQLLAVACLLLLGTCEEFDRPLSGALALVTFALGTYALAETARATLIPAAGINLVSRASAFEWAIELKHRSLSAPPAGVLWVIAGVAFICALMPTTNLADRNGHRAK